MKRKPGLILTDRLFQRRHGLGSRRHVEGGTCSERVLFLHGRREGRGSGLCVCLNCEDEKKGIERALPIIAEAIAAGRLRRWVADSCQVGEVETLRTEGSRVDWAKVAAEVGRLAALAPANREVETVAAARRFGQPPWLLDLFVKFVEDQRRRWNRAARFMVWVLGPGGKHVLASHVDLNDGRPLVRRLNTDDTEVEGPRRLRLLLWHAIAQKQLQGGVKHEAWRLYGGPIPEATKRLLKELAELPWKKYELRRTATANRLGYCETTIDWLANQEKARRQDPVRQARGGAAARFKGRKTGKKQTPKSRSWQFCQVGAMLHVHSKGYPIYGRVVIDRFTLEWLLPVRNRAAGEAHVKPAVDARKTVKNAAREWRKCSIGSSEAKGAAKALLREQHRFRDALAAVGAKRSRNWTKAGPQFDELPFVEASRRDPQGLRRWLVDELLKHRDPPAGRSVTSLLAEARKRFYVGKHAARMAFQFAQGKTGNSNWTTKGGRPRKSAS
jgi:hypothetical protein